MDGGAWWAAVHGVAKSRTRLSDFIFTFHFHALEKEMATHSSVLAWRIPGTGEPGGLPSMGSHRVGHDLSGLAAVVAAGFSQGTPNRNIWIYNIKMCMLYILYNINKQYLVVFNSNLSIALGGLVVLVAKCVWLLQPHGLQPARFLCPWDSLGKNTGVGCHFLLQGTFLTQGSNPGLLWCRQIPYQLSYKEAPIGLGNSVIYLGKLKLKFSENYLTFLETFLQWQTTVGYLASIEQGWNTVLGA